ncbi:hypothetical protein [Parasitella parasitica]|uniref:Peptidase S59 domain-containing protein n=1 Tax=Parasitella parasitica TaxID=35722 RepID=A0A0B7MSV2_9FUNG|nr:hypothetical protein [Parasitella parasitica]
MFGKSAFGSTGAFGQQQQQQPTSLFGQQQQQPQQQGGAFGGFGANPSGGAFGATPTTTSAFGQPAQQSAFGSTPGATGFGATPSAFGQARPSAFGSTQQPAFGATQNNTTTGFGGGFGSAPTNSSFGSTATQPSSGLFGQRPTTGAFGTTANAFGQPQQQQTSAFGGMGTTASTFGQQANAGGVNQGTAAADFAPTQDRDISTGINHFFQTITAMPQYKNYSLEELRLQDYQQNRKNANSATGGGAFGASTGGAFGASTGGAFGASSTGGAFGASSTGGAFGATSAPTTAFGQPASTSAFGQQQTPAFGQPASTSAFGQQQAPAFGQPASTSAFGTNTGTSGGLFGQPFGSTTSAFNQPSTTNTGFGAAASKPFAFGGTPAPATGGFGQQPAASGFGGFGQKPATTTTTGFGGFGNTGTTGGFGQPAAAGFGASASKPATSFSITPAAPATGTTGGFGGFGATPAANTGGFGQNSTAGGLFGAAKPAAPTTSLFGNTAGAAAGTTGGFGGFGATAPGQTGATGGLFGQNATTGLGATGGGFFGNNALGTTNTGFGGFGQQQQGANTFNLPAQGGLTSFGTNPLQPGMQQQPLVATVDKNPYGNNPLFDLNKVSNTTTGLRPGASAALDSTTRKPNHPHFPISPRTVSKIKLRGFSFNPSTRANVRKTATDSLEGISDDAVLGSGAYASRANNKKLVFNDNIDAASIVNLVNSKQSHKRRVLFDPQLEYVAAQENITAEPATTRTTTTTTATTTTTTISEMTATRDVSSSLVTSSTSTIASKNDYYISPTLETLASMPKEGLKQVQNLVVGRRGYGEIRYEQPVDLSEVDLEDIMGNIVVIEEKTVVVYPDQNSKPAKGVQLNLPATVKLENCFSRDKNTGALIKDPAHPRFSLFRDRLRKREGMEFVDYSDNGEWTFKVKEF